MKNYFIIIVNILLITHICLYLAILIIIFIQTIIIILQLYNFSNTFHIEKQTKILFELFKISKKREEIIIPKTINCERQYSIKDGIFEEINNYYYFQYDSKKLYIIKYNEEENSLIYNPNLSPEFNEKIYSIFISKENKQIYACLSNEKWVKIFDYNLKLRINDQEIKFDNNPPGRFNKCIFIGNNNFATSDNEFISIWTKIENGYIKNIQNFRINKTSDLLLVNEDYLIYAQPNKEALIIFDAKKLNPEKI